MGIYSTLAKTEEKKSPRKTKDSRDKKEIKQTNIQTSKQTNKQVSKRANKFTSKQDYVTEYLAMKAYATYSFRLPPEIMKKFNQIFHRAQDRYEKELQKYALIVAALAVFLWDYEEKGKESDLYKLLIEKKEGR